MKQRIQNILVLCALLYLFLVCITLMGASFKHLGEDFSKRLITATASPVVGLMIGMLTTAVIQSSSTTTSLIVGLVAAGALTLQGAVPMIMGANIGTTVTNTMVALTSVNRREEFRRSFAGATMHDFFNLFSLLLLFPLEMSTHFLERSGSALADLLVGTGAVEFHSPIKAITKPVSKWVLHTVEQTGWGEVLVGSVGLAIALAGIFTALAFLPRLLKHLLLARAEGAFFQLLGRGGMVGILVGAFLTVMVQSSSITTALLVPMIGAGILPLEGAFAITLGANVGTTVTGLLASTTGTHDAVAIALVHFLFNVTGIALIYPFKPVRMIPIHMARKLADLSVRSKLVPFAYLFSLFFLLPGAVILMQRLLAGN
ncbi:MAG: sodium:phosphate symporter [Gemmatimonadota bacterium]|nr:MAG: sodium:phosphate symporter [Gemmatimonadota bacterium]